MALVALRDRDDQAQVRVDHALLGGTVAALDSLRELDFLGRREQLVLADVVHEQGQRVDCSDVVGNETQLGLVVGLVGGSDLDPTGLELPAEHGQLVLVEVVLEGSGLEDVRIQDAVVLGVFDECSQFSVVEHVDDLRSFLSRGTRRADSRKRAARATPTRTYGEGAEFPVYWG